MEGTSANSTLAEGRVRTGVSVVIPVLDEEEAIGAVIDALKREAVDEIIVADGGSQDRTVTIAEARGARVIHAGKGYGRACATGPKPPAARAGSWSSWTATAATSSRNCDASSRRLPPEPMTSSLRRVCAAGGSRAQWRGTNSRPDG